MAFKELLANILNRVLALVQLSQTLNRLSISRPWINRFSLSISVLSVTLMMGSLLLFCPTQYQTNDDVGMMLTSCGKVMSLKPDAQLMFSNLFYGDLLVGLTSLFPGVFWYPILQVFILYLSFIAIVNAVLKVLSNSFSLFLCLLLIFCFYLFIYLDLQFTVVSAVATVAGVITIYAGFREAKSGWPKLLFALLLLTLGVLVRFESFVLTVLVILPFFLFRLKKITTGKWFRKVWFVFPVAFISWLGLQHLSENNDPEYYQYRKNLIGILDYYKLDFFSADQREEFLFKSGFSLNDYYLLKEWSFQDKAVFSIEKLKVLNDLIDANLVVKKDFGTALKHYFSSFQSHWSIQLLLLFSILLLKWFPFLRVTIYLGFCILVMALIEVFFKAPPLRVQMSVWVVFFIIAMLEFEPAHFRTYPWTFVRNGISVVALIAILFGLKLMFSSTKFLVRCSQLIEARHARLSGYVSGLELKNNDLYIVWSLMFPMEWLNPFHPQHDFIDKKLYTMGHKQIPERKQAMLKHFNCQNVYSDVVDHPHVFYLVDSTAKYKLQFMENFMLEHYHLKAKPVVVSSYGGVQKVRWVSAL